MLARVAVGHSIVKKSKHDVSAHSECRHVSKPSRSCELAAEQLWKQIGWQSGMKLVTAPDDCGVANVVAKA